MTSVVGTNAYGTVGEQYVKRRLLHWLLCTEGAVGRVCKGQLVMAYGGPCPVSLHALRARGEVRATLGT